MTFEYYDENERLYNSEASDCEADDDADEYYDFDDDKYEEDHIYANICDKYPLSSIFKDVPSRVNEWRSVRIGEMNLRVSNSGKVQFPDISCYYVTEGHREIGTPYRYIRVQVTDDKWCKYYVHDIVWRTFKEDTVVPDGWEVRHIDYTEMDDGKCYLNNIEDLDVYKKEVIRAHIELTIL